MYMIFKTVMIRDLNNPVSVAYSRFCSPSWYGFDLQFYDAVTPANLHEQRGINFKIKRSGRDHSDTEKACFYSQYNLWKKCALENIPYLILEHDAYLKRPECIHFNSSLKVQFLGQHAMEAVMYHPEFCRTLVINAGKKDISYGPMAFVDNELCYSKAHQSRYGIPHARYQGPQSPVKSVVDPNIGNTINHDTNLKERLKEDGDLFYQVDLKAAGIFNPDLYKP